MCDVKEHNVKMTKPVGLILTGSSHHKPTNSIPTTPIIVIWDNTYCNLAVREAPIQAFT